MVELDVPCPVGEHDRLLDEHNGRLALKAIAARNFQSTGRLFLDSIEQAIAAALVDAYAGKNRSVQPLRGGLGPGRLRTVKELVHAKVEDELTLIEMAQSVDLSPAHFS